MTTATERPILFNGEMVRAILAGEKTVTRRVVTVPWGSRGNMRTAPYEPYYPEEDGELYIDCDGRCELAKTHMRCPYGRVGDGLWVKETWQAYELDGGELSIVDKAQRGDQTIREYFADNAFGIHKEYRATSDVQGPWTPSIFMLRKFSRINLRVVSVGIERLQGITAAEVLIEGITSESPGYDINGFVPTFRKLWESINGKRHDGMFAWDQNPWVWRVEFERVGK